MKVFFLPRQIILIPLYVALQCKILCYQYVSITDLIIHANQCSITLTSMRLALGPDVIILINTLCSECFLVLLWSCMACIDFYNSYLHSWKWKKMHEQAKKNSPKEQTMWAELVNHAGIVFKRGSPVPGVWNQRVCGDICQQMVCNQSPRQWERLSCC